MPDLPTQDEVIAWGTSLSNWGRWGAEDTLGTLNFLSPEKVRQAAALVTDGVGVSMAREIGFPLTPPPNQVTGPTQRYMIATGQSLPDVPSVGGSMEYIGMVFHGHSITHIDALSHCFYGKRMYNGMDAELVTAGDGATRLAITDVPHGIATRGVLLDIPRIRGVDWLEAGEGAFIQDLEAAEERQGVRVGRGDAVFLRTGFGRKNREQGPQPASEGCPGWHASTLPWLHEREVAVVGCDSTNDVDPSPYQDPPSPLHNIGMTAMGLWLIDNCDLEDVAEAAADRGRYEFMVTINALRLEGGTGSPVNPVALF